MACWPVNNSVTLTYSDEYLPSDNSLNIEDVQLFLKRLRKQSTFNFRVFYVGEYGDTYERPHYHLLLFNYPSCHRGRTRHDLTDCCPVCDKIRDTWKRGRIQSQYCDENSARYVSKYLVKAMTNRQDERLNGRYPEFARMSLRPGIGAYYADMVAQTMNSDAYSPFYKDAPDVPSYLSRGRGKLPMGRYLRKRLRVATERSPNAPEETLQESQKEVRVVQEIARLDQIPLKEALIREGEQEYLNLMSRVSVFNQRRRM